MSSDLKKLGALSSARPCGRMAKIANNQGEFRRQLSFLRREGPFDLWADLKPRPLLVLHFSDLPICRISLPFSLGGPFRQIAMVFLMSEVSATTR